MASGVLLSKPDGKRVTKLSELGGSLKILDNWESVTHTDPEGKSETTVTIRGKEYVLDQDVYNELINDGSEK